LLIDAAEDGDSGVAEDVCDLGFAEAGGVVFKGDVELGVGRFGSGGGHSVGEFTERAELIVGEGRLEFEFGSRSVMEKL